MLDLQQLSVWNVEIQLIHFSPSAVLYQSYSQNEMRQQFLSETIKHGTAYENSEFNLISIPSLAPNCTTLYRLHESRKSFIPRFVLCSLLFIQIFSDEAAYKNIFDKGTHCLTRPKCNPINNWHYIFLSGTKSDTSSSTTYPISIAVKAVMQNAILFVTQDVNPLYLVRDKWHSFDTFQEKNTSVSISKIKKLASQEIHNYNLEKFFIITPYPLYLSFIEEYKRSILRGERVTHPNLLAAYDIIDKVNATPIPPHGPPVGINGLVPGLRSIPNSISIPLGVNEERWKEIEYSTLFAINYVSFLTHSPRRAPSYGFMFLFQPFQVPVWNALVSFFFAVVITGVILLLTFSDLTTVSKRISCDCGTKLNFFNRSTVFMMKALILPLLDQSSDLAKINTNMRLKFLLGIWSLCGIVLGSLYRSNIVSFLVQPSYIVPPTTFKDLINSRYSIRLSPGFTMLAINGLMMDMKARSRVDLQDRFKLSGERERTQCFTDITIGDNSCVGYQLTLDIFARLLLTDELGSEVFLRSSDRILPIVSGIPISPLSNIKPIADKVLTQLLASGLMDKYMEIYSELNSQKGRKDAAIRTTNQPTGKEKNPQLVSIAVVLYPIYLMIAGFLASFIAFVYESRKRTIKIIRLSRLFN